MDDPKDEDPKDMDKDPRVLGDMDSDVAMAKEFPEEIAVTLNE